MFEDVRPIPVRKTMLARGMKVSLMQLSREITKTPLSLSMSKFPDRTKSQPARFVSTNLAVVDGETLLSNSMLDYVWSGKTHSCCGEPCCCSWGAKKYCWCSAFEAKSAAYITYWYLLLSLACLRRLVHFIRIAH